VGGIVVAIDVKETTSEQRDDEEMKGGCLLPSATALSTRLSGARGTHRHNTPGNGKGRGGEGIRRTGRGRQWSRAWSLCGFYKASGTLLGFAFWWGPARGSIGGWLLGF
jgi:hypothetical protein